LVEREFGFFILRSPSNAEVCAARDAMLEALESSLFDRTKPAISSTRIITGVEPYQAQLINKWRQGALLVPGRTLGIVECAPAAYISIGANEAEKAAEIDIVEVRAVGRYGRLFISGSENSVKAGVEGAVRAVEGVQGKSG
ncbi:BMC domain-containing protein, partial [Thioalkalivibrio sp. HK1]|uniref:BMC domain-containing protein n=1 Tax=Thioalkalivibrio sp. HK1 TaxID=1469245 RepID=UPI000470F5C7